MGKIPLRWIAISVFLLSSTLSYLDRQLVAALAPTLMSEFHLSNFEFGEIASVFSIVYALTAPAAGLFIDRVGLNLGASISVIAWSLAGAATGLTQTFRGLLACRTMLGIAEAAGIPGFGKAGATYLEPRELALGTAFNQIGISLGLFAAPLIVGTLAPRYGWRSAFVACGALGLLWAPLWWFTARRVPARPSASQAPAAPVADLLRDRRLWGMVIANMFIMTLYTLWTNWTTAYFNQAWRLTQEEANLRYAWLPSIFATLGGFFGGALAFRGIRGGAGPITARLRICWISAVAALLATAAIPLTPTPAIATALICMSFFWTLCSSTNMYALPIDVFGPGRAAFSVAALTSGYGLMQAFLSPAIGSIVDHFGFPQVCVAVSAMPLVGVWILHVGISSHADISSVTLHTSQ
jgi:MFS transporter, ACS family, aldohexuronate transporter